jgi:hypothetical protein
MPEPRPDRPRRRRPIFTQWQEEWNEERRELAVVLSVGYVRRHLDNPENRLITLGGWVHIPDDFELTDAVREIILDDLRSVTRKQLAEWKRGREDGRDA